MSAYSSHMLVLSAQACISRGNLFVLRGGPGADLEGGAPDRSAGAVGDASSWLGQWVHASGVAMFHCAWVYKASKNEIELTIEQVTAGSTGVSASLLLDITAALI